MTGSTRPASVLRIRKSEARATCARDATPPVSYQHRPDDGTAAVLCRVPSRSPSSANPPLFPVSPSPFRTITISHRQCWYGAHEHAPYIVRVLCGDGIGIDTPALSSPPPPLCGGGGAATPHTSFPITDCYSIRPSAFARPLLRRPHNYGVWDGVTCLAPPTPGSSIIWMGSCGCVPPLHNIMPPSHHRIRIPHITRASWAHYKLG